MRKKSTLILALAAAAAVGIGGFFAAFAVVDGTVIARSASFVDLTDRDLTPAQYESIRGRLPEKQILWSVPFQGQHLSSDTEFLHLSSLTAEELDLLEYLPNLKKVDASDCTDYEALMLLASARPDCEILYSVQVGSSLVPGNSESLTAENADIEQLRRALALLPNLRAVTLTGRLPDTQELLNLQKDYPNIGWHMEISLGEEVLPSDVLALCPKAGTDFGELQRVLPLFSRLQSLDLTALSLDDGQCKALIAAFPDLEVRCTLTAGGRVYPSDETTIDLTGVKLTHEELRQTLTVFRQLRRLTVDGCGLDDETLDGLNREFPNTDVVWTLNIGGRRVPTDARFFYPAKRNSNNLPNQEELQKLRYCHNMVAVDIGHANTTTCEWAAEMPHLKYLILADTQISDLTPLAGLKELVYLELFRLPITDYSPLLGCTALQDLHIGMTHADPEPLSKMTWLHNLQWNQGTWDPATAEAVKKLPEQLSDTNVMLPDSSLNIGGIWRYLPNYYVFRDIIGGNFLNQSLAANYWGDDAHAILSCDQGSARFAGEVLAEAVKRRMEAGEPIPGIKNVGSEKARILYESLCAAMP